MAKRIKFPTLAPGSEVRINNIRIAASRKWPFDTNTKNIALKQWCAIASAEWLDVAEEAFDPAYEEQQSKLYYRALEIAREWHVFRREHCK